MRQHVNGNWEEVSGLVISGSAFLAKALMLR